MEEAQLLAERIAIIDHGRIQAIDTPHALIAQHAGSGTVRFSTDQPVERADLERIPSVIAATQADGSEVEGAGAYAYQLRASDPDAVLPELLALSQRSGVGLRAVEVLHGTLEDVFLQIAGRELRD
jgi:ABC-2 type transport system ATP-binding protein